MMFEPTPEEDRWANEVIGAAIEVHRHLGPGYHERTYEEALSFELGLRGVPFKRQVPVSVVYKGHTCGEGKIDLVIADRLILELKAIDALGDVHKSQVISYLKATGLKLGILLNFNVPVLRDGIKRVIRSRADTSLPE